MRTVSIINLKGGVAKSISSINIAHILATVFDKKVLVVDLDKQANTTKFFNKLSYEDLSVSDLLTDKDVQVGHVIKNTDTPNLDIIPSNMKLLTACRQVLLDVTGPAQHVRLKKALKPVINDYDFCIIDHAPDINMGTINGLCMTDDVLIPVKIDEFALDGLNVLVEQLNDIQEERNPALNLMGVFITMYQSNNLNKEGLRVIRESGYPYLDTYIRNAVKVGETTFAHKPLAYYAPTAKPTKDYLHLVGEYLSKLDKY